jgi:hypothetical protein
LLFPIPISRNELTAATARHRFFIFESDRISQSRAIANGAAEAVATAQPRSDRVAERQCFDRCHVTPESRCNVRARHVGGLARLCPPFDRKWIILGQEDGHEGPADSGDEFVRVQCSSQSTRRGADPKSDAEDAYQRLTHGSSSSASAIGGSNLAMLRRRTTGRRPDLGGRR